MKKLLKQILPHQTQFTLHKNLHFLKKKKIDNVIIEASSHGLDQKRFIILNFKGAIFTIFLKII